MADQYVFNKALVEFLHSVGHPDPQDIVNSLSGRKKMVREWLDACDALEKLHGAWEGRTA
jgi:hypothetical protein